MNGGDWRQILTNGLMTAFAVLTALVVHEFSHARASDLLGDHTARQQGRLTLNPLKHVDIFGLLMLFIVGFGWAKPVSVNMANLKKPRRDMCVIALAGPLSNLLSALLIFVIMGFLRFISHPSDLLAVLLAFLWVAATINVGLGVFNLFPIPPLDGSKVLGVVLPESVYYRILQYERYGMIALVILLYTGWLDKPLYFLRGVVLGALSTAGFWPSDALAGLLHG